MEMNWISVDEKLPGNHMDVIIHSYAQGVMNGYYWNIGTQVKHGFYSNSGDVEDGIKLDITHWMPMPAAPVTE